MKKYLGLIVVVMLVLGGTVSGSDFSKVVVDQWEIPFLNAWTGPAAGYGILCDYFQKTAVEEINAAGGIAGQIAGDETLRHLYGSNSRGPPA